MRLKFEPLGNEVIINTTRVKDNIKTVVFEVFLYRPVESLNN